ncbi:MAG: hypothetical protein A3A57_03020 [Candidatus Woykebacteria bacterium RIFCSPLOWO2_01_FULL_41_12]|uniref:Uncharacterized protein n=1 Tax=Candidatus Woykebacteria bacterium RIFCSPLOWO2_01_FULL_41_12 TaxID=1802604 RepID=A0A1G1WWW0_9BACT|nr:MAG: hypothetical protein A3A57_03020 [Candidatus Woykebacteria bacterium RIFCSPLOWO2_01_FULL_41_12]
MICWYNLINLDGGGKALTTDQDAREEGESTVDQERPRRSWGGWLVYGLIALVVVTLLINEFWPFGSDTKPIGTGIGPESEPDRVPTPALLHDYKMGEIRRAGWTHSLDEAPPSDYAGELELWGAGFHIHDGDIVEILGTPILVRDYWRWPIKVLQGGIYVEGGEYWVYDEDAGLFGPTTLGERPVPDFSIGEEVAVNYNFCLRDGPAGSTHPYTSGCALAYGMERVTILEAPVLAEGRYWCHVLRGNGENWWIPCEFQRIE